MFRLDEEHLELQASFKEFAENEIRPLAKEIDETERFPLESIKKMAEMGMMGLPIPEEYGGLYQMEEPIEMERFGRKIPIPDSYEEWEPIVVPNYFIDTNHHMNNAKYILMGEEFLPEGFEVHRIRAEYKKAAVLGDTICPSVAAESSCVSVKLCDESGEAYANIIFE